MRTVAFTWRTTLTDRSMTLAMQPCAASPIGLNLKFNLTCQMGCFSVLKTAHFTEHLQSSSS